MTAASSTDVDDFAESYGYALTRGERVRAREAQLFGSPRSRWNYSPGGISDTPYGETQNPDVDASASGRRRASHPGPIRPHRGSPVQRGLKLLLGVLIRRAVKRIDGNPSPQASHPGPDIRAEVPCRALVRAHAILTSARPRLPHLRR